MASTAAFALLLILAVVPAISAVTYQVGDTDGWSVGVDYTAWAKGKTFRVGDTLEFKYGSSHSVTVVDKAGFDSCNDRGATQSFFDGDTKLDLKAVGTIHFICSTPGHCLGGMKLSVPIIAAATTPATPPPPSPPKSPPPKSSPKSPPPKSSPKTPSPRASPPAKSKPEAEPSSAPSLSPSTHSPSPSPPNAASKGAINYGIVGLTMVLMYNVMN